MATNRRHWLKQLGLSAAGLGLVNFRSAPDPGQDRSENYPEDQPIKLSSNENTYGPSPVAKLAMSQNINISNRYNWSLTHELMEQLASIHDVSVDQVMMGAGSSEILDVVVRHSALNGGSFIIADPSYEYWTYAAQKIGLTKIAVPLTTAKKLDLEAMSHAIRPDTKLIYICNPNNPTGTVCDREKLITFITEASQKCMVLIDEAYLDFTPQHSLSTLTTGNKNLVVAKTFSKIYGLAGARVGYAIAHAETINQLSELLSWVNGSISVASAAAALAALKDKKFVAETYSANEKVRKYTVEQLEKLNLECIPSFSNFIYFSLATYKKDYFQQLKNHNIIGTKIYEEQGKWTRITVGTMLEMKKFINAIE